MMQRSDSFSKDSPVWLGIDLGTQSVRAMAVSAMGAVLGLGVHSLTSHRDGPRHEQEPEEWWTATVAACRAAMGDLPREAVCGVAVDATPGLADVKGVTRVISLPVELWVNKGSTVRDGMVKVVNAYKQQYGPQVNAQK